MFLDPQPIYNENLFYAIRIGLLFEKNQIKNQTVLKYPFGPKIINPILRDLIDFKSLVLIKNNGIVYSIKEFWRKNFIGISSDAKILTYINTNASKPNINTINFEDLKLCNILKQFNKDKDGVERLKSLNLELIFKLSTEKNITILFFNIDDDLSEDFELQRIEKWHKLINDAIIKSPIVKLAS